MAIMFKLRNVGSDIFDLRSFQTLFCQFVGFIERLLASAAALAKQS